MGEGRAGAAESAQWESWHDFGWVTPFWGSSAPPCGQGDEQSRMQVKRSTKIVNSYHHGELCKQTSILLGTEGVTLVLTDARCAVSK